MTSAPPVIGVGDYATDTVRAVSGFDPCARENVRRVCAAQSAMGFRPDGKWGEDSYIAALMYDPQARPGCSPRPAWWPPAGQGACAPTVNEVLVETKKALAELEAWKRAREGSGTMSGIRLNGRPIAGLGLGQDPAPQGTPSAAPPPAPPVGQTTATPVVHHWYSSTGAKVGIGVAAAAAVGTVVYVATRKKGRGKRRSRR